MLIRDAIEGRVSARSERTVDAVHVGLPLSLKTERMDVKSGMLKRLASSRAFTLGNRSGVLKAAQNRSGRAFRLDVRQKVIVKALVSRAHGQGRRSGSRARQACGLPRASGRRGGRLAAGVFRPWSRWRSTRF